MFDWESTELHAQRAKLSDKMAEHYDRCCDCYMDGQAQRITCEAMKDYRAQLAKIKEHLDAGQKTTQ